MPADTAPPPRHLRKEGRDLWRAIIEEHPDLAADELALLCLACEQADTQDQARKVIDKDGMTYASKSGAVKPRPELSIERQAARLISTFIRQLKLDTEPVKRGKVVRHSDRIARAKRGR